MSQQFSGNSQIQNRQEHSKSVDIPLNDSTSTTEHDHHDSEDSRSEFNYIRDERDRYKKEIGFLKHELDSKREELNNVYTILERERNKSKSQDNELLKTQQKDFEEIKVKLAEFQAKDAESLKKYSMLEEQNGTLKKMLEVFEKNRKKIQEDVEGYKGQILELEKKLTDFQEKVAEIKTSSPTSPTTPLKDEIEQLKTAQFKLETQLEAKTQELSRAHKTINELQMSNSTRLEQEKQTTIDNEKRYSDLEKEKAEIQEANYQLTQDLKDKNERLVEARKKIHEMENTCSEIKLSLHHLKTQRDRKPHEEEVINQLKASLKEKEHLISEEQNQLKELKDKMTLSEKEMEVIDKELIELRRENESLKKKNEKLYAKYNAQTDEVWRTNDMANQAVILEKELNQMKTLLQQRDNELMGLKKKFIPDYEEHHSSLVATNERLSKELDEKKQILSQIGTELRAGETKLKDQITSIKRQRRFSVTLFFTIVMSLMIAGGFLYFNKTYCLRKC